jgi:putative endonuclease
MQFWVYLLRCADGSYYAGHTEDLEGRLWQHQQGICCEWTRRRRPVELVWCDSAPTRHEAIAFERRIKGWSRAKKEALIAGDWDRIGWLAKPPHERSPVSVRPERRRERAEVEGPLAHPFEKRPSTSLRTNEEGAQTANECLGRMGIQVGQAQAPNQAVRPERRRDSAEVEGRLAQPSEKRPSTSLRTSGHGGLA